MVSAYLALYTILGTYFGGRGSLIGPHFIKRVPIYELSCLYLKVFVQCFE